MSKKIYNKLVRDRIPEIIEKTGKAPVTEILCDEEYLKMLDIKLEEELAEYQKDKSLEELADLLEVIRAVTKARGYTVEELERVRIEKYDERGGFQKKILLKEVRDITEVAAALIWDKDKFMICQRPENKSCALLWEFVGGKAEKGETLEEALIRECREELDITVSVGDIFIDVIHEYPDITVHLTLFNSVIAQGEPKLLEHNDLRWITPSEIPYYNFCPADKEILEKIIEKGNRNEEKQA